MKRSILASTFFLSLAVMAQSVEQEDPHLDQNPSYEEVADDGSQSYTDSVSDEDQDRDSHLDEVPVYEEPQLIE
jgi:hypothetical protein